MRLLILTLLLLVFIACQPSLNDTLCQAWKFNGFNITSELEAELADAANKSTRLKFRDYLKNGASETNWRFYPDGTCATLLNGQYSAKRWELNESTGQLVLISGNIHEFYQIERDGENLTILEISNKNVINRHVTATLSPNPEYEEGAIDLLVPSRNTWRNKPANPEPFQKIKKRLSEQLVYMVDYFELTNKKKQGYFNTDHLNSPFRFYSGGIGLLNQNELPAIWLNQFHNQGDALEAYTLLVLAFRSGLVFPHSEKTFTDAYARFLKQVNAFILAQEEPESLIVH
ncbi:hypothetical protein [Spirosoma litoris]